MKKIVTLFILLFFCSQLSTSLYARTTVVLTNEEQSRQGTDRTDLHFPKELWEKVKTNVSYPSKSLGYSSDEMEHFENSKYILPKIKRFFRNVETIPEYTGNRATIFNKYCERSFVLSAYSYIDLGFGAGHQFSVPEDENNWGFDWIPENSSSLEVIEMLLAMDESIISLTDYQKTSFLQLPNEVQLYIARVLAASYETQIYLEWAFDFEFLKNTFNVEDINDIKLSSLYPFASKPWNDYPVEPASFELIDTLDMKYLSTANSLYSRW